MNQEKWSKELERISNRNYRNMDKELYNFYKETLKKLKFEVKKYIEEFEELSYSKRLEVQRQLEIAFILDEILWGLSNNVQPVIYKYIEYELVEGYYGSWYNIENQINTNISFKTLNKSYIESLLDKKINGKNFSKRLYEYREQLAREVTNALIQGAKSGKGYKDIAKQISELTEANYKRSLRIARTEGGRVQSTVRQKYYKEAKAKGIDIKKRWIATLDEKTRESHADLDGVTIGVDEKFIYDGYEADGPRLFGIAALDINCRCSTISIINGIGPNIRKDNITKEVIKYKNYNEWRRRRIG